VRYHPEKTENIQSVAVRHGAPAHGPGRLCQLPPGARGEGLEDVHGARFEGEELGLALREGDVGVSRRQARQRLPVVSVRVSTQQLGEVAARGVVAAEHQQGRAPECQVLGLDALRIGLSPHHLARQHALLQLEAELHHGARPPGCGAEHVHLVLQEALVAAQVLPICDKLKVMGFDLQ